MRYHHWLMPALALGLGGLLVVPIGGYSLGGSSLGLAQRDFRVFNNFSDLSANDNQTTDSSFPGYQGAVMAIWKASVEWSSGLHGDGSGDPHQPFGIGSGGANFDPSFQGEATDIGTLDGNVHSEIQGSSGGIYAFAESGLTGGWRIRYYSAWTWDDGPGTAIGGVDLQGVATHEYGHALGLGHSSVAGATMAAGFLGSGVDLRSIEPDDQAGIQAIYGLAGAAKPRISGSNISAGNLTITGSGFSIGGNEVWLTQATAGGTGDPVKVTGVAATGGGTSISIPMPAAAGEGDVLVLAAGTSGSSLSNPWPTSFASTATAPVVTSVIPTSVPALVVDGAASVTLTGSGFAGLTTLKVDGIDVPSTEYQVAGDTLVTLAMPAVSKLGSIAIEVATPFGSTTASVIVTAVAPTVELENSAPGFLIQSQGIGVQVAGAPGDVLFLGASPDLVPTILPGIVDLAIGSGYTSMYVLGTYVIPAKGWHGVVFVTGGGLPIGLTVHLQAAAFTAASGYTFPGIGTNVQTGTVLF
ncbi:MAG: matrixin family metalloprotease [Planctomycetota bacterium]|nr:matrixin family metalloprotease [Planctomycetota bacterium]